MKGLVVVVMGVVLDVVIVFDGSRYNIDDYLYIDLLLNVCVASSVGGVDGGGTDGGDYYYRSIVLCHYYVDKNYYLPFPIRVALILYVDSVQDSLRDIFYLLNGGDSMTMLMIMSIVVVLYGRQNNVKYFQSYVVVDDADVVGVVQCVDGKSLNKFVLNDLLCFRYVCACVLANIQQNLN